jgi:hypothetical protein
MTVAGFHRMARPPTHHLSQCEWSCNSSSISEIFPLLRPQDILFPIKGECSEFSARILSRRVLCLDIPFSPLMFQVMIFIMMSWVGDRSNLP